MDLNAKCVDVVLTKKFNLKNDAGDTVEDLTHHYDFSNFTLGQVFQKALRTIVIDDQRALRPLSTDAIQKTEDTTLLVENVGKKPEDPKALINRLKGMGMSEDDILEMLKG